MQIEEREFIDLIQCYIRIRDSEDLSIILKSDEIVDNIAKRYGKTITKNVNFKWFYSPDFLWYGEAVNHCVKIMASLKDIWSFLDAMNRNTYHFVRTKREEVRV